jgi:hypothetical protein
MVFSKCHHSAWLTNPIRQRRNSPPQRPVKRWTLHPSQHPSTWTLEAIWFEKTEETPVIRSAPYILCLNVVLILVPHQVSHLLSTERLYWVSLPKTL